MKTTITTGLLAVTLLLSVSLRAQITTFYKIYPSSFNQDGKDVLPTSDGGYLIAASTGDHINNDLDVLAVKTNSTGDTVWSTECGGNLVDYPNAMLATSDGNYFIVGGSQSFGGGDLDVYLIKISPAGNILWTKTYGGYGNEDGNEIIATSDGNYAIIGGSNSANLSNNDMQFIKIDPSGNVIWTKYYGGPGYESARSVKLCPDGGFVIAGKTASSYTAPSKAYFVKTNFTGDTLWTQTYGGPNSYEGKSILANGDGSYTIAMDDSSGARDSDVRVIKIGASGAITWDKMYGGMQKDICKMIQPTSDGGYIVASISRSFGWVNPDMWILKLDASGDTAWTHHYGGPDHEHCFAVRQTADGGFIAVGHSKSYSPNIEIMLVKLDVNGTLMGISGIVQLANKDFFTAYPNPSADGKISINLSEEITSCTIKVSNEIGEVVLVQNVEAGKSQPALLNLSGKNPGLYLVSVQSGKRCTQHKIILQ